MKLQRFVFLMGPVCLLHACTGSLEADGPDPSGLYADEPGYAGGAEGPSPLGVWARDGELVLDDAGPADPADPASPADPAPATPAAEDPPAEAPSGGGGATGASGVASLGPLPAAMSGLRWPTAPTTTRTVTATSAAEVQAAAAQPGTRIDVRGAVGGGVTITANDIDIVADAATDLGLVTLAKGVARVRVTGGRWAGFLIEIPADFDAGGAPSFRPEHMVEDVWIRDTTVDSPDNAFELRGRRIALVNNDVTAIRYSVWTGDTGPTMQNEDVILHDNRFESSGPESTVRLVQIRRSATVDNVFANPNKHNYRVHGITDLSYAARNLLIDNGVMMGTMDGDALRQVWFEENVFHHTAPDLFNVAPTVSALRAADNVAHTDVRFAFFEGTAGSDWELTNTVVRPYTPPPR